MRGPKLCVDLGRKRITHVTTIPALFETICDDAALFPPGNATMSDALHRHVRYRSSSVTDAVGPFVLPANRFSELSATMALVEYPMPMELSVTFPQGPNGLGVILAEASSCRAINIVAVEIAVPSGSAVNEVFRELTLSAVAELDVFVEIPRDARQPEVIAAVAGSNFRAKFRTGGVVKDAYPDASELSQAICAAVSSGVPFKATAGLHHAVRNIDPVTGFEQHGFLNVILGVDAACSGAGLDKVAALLDCRDHNEIVGHVSSLGPKRIARSRAQFVSFGTCSVIEPLGELVKLGLISPSAVSEFEEGTTA